MGDADPGLTYESYLRVPELLALQVPRSTEHDEHLFIVIHQVYELWFKQILTEFGRVAELLGHDERARAGHGLNRVLRILKVLVSQLDVLETMTPLEFLSFRDRLDAASGFQSAQFRAIEAGLGALWDGLLGPLARTGFGPAGSDDDVERLLLDVYRSDPAASELCERFVDLDEGLQEWRYHHLKMVQRTIGTRGGTGGSTGAEYLATTIRPAFPALWAIRARF